MANNRVYHPFELGSVLRSDINVFCRQVYEIPSIDGKQISILDGKSSCSVLCPCSGCMEIRDNLGQPREWIQTRLLLDGKGCERLHDALPRTGNNCIDTTSMKWQIKTCAGRLPMTDSERRKINIETGSSFHKPVISIHACKQNGGVFHTFQGHTTRFLEEVTNEIHNFETDCSWRTRLLAFRDEMKEERSGLRMRFV